ncbi:hypothetical protein DQ04_03591030 [Trypanosoma grayi]|uniref:hypothetical protein n=1 Tax=Trypanosoma grayi TaxID=71804 RepID=UPI0004F42F36|nr:hypothetical protein DQ04_03591030 [Trypanosoma grayi]KEG10548.1 hypothetical protein DQ04_03591030 [Trypanosoma grayi]
MNLKNYMPSIVSEVRQFSRAYVDSLVSPGEGKHHDEAESVAAQTKQDVPSAVAAAASVSFSTRHIPHTQTSAHVGVGKGRVDGTSSNSGSNWASRRAGAVESYEYEPDYMERPGVSSAPPHTYASTPIGSASLAASHEVQEEGSRPGVTRAGRGTAALPQADSTSTTVVPESTGLRRTIRKKPKASRSRFGAVKLEPEEEAEAAAEVVVASASSVALDTGSGVPSIGMPHCSRSSSSSACQREQQCTTAAVTSAPIAAPAPVASAAVSVTTPPPPPPTAAVAEKVVSSTLNKELQEWSNKRDAILCLLRSSAARRMTPVLFNWVQEALSFFAVKVAGGALASVVDDDSAAMMSSELSPVGDYVERVWHDAESVVRPCVAHAVPPEVFGPCAPADVTDVAAANDSESCEEFVFTSCRGEGPLWHTLHDTLAIVRRWRDEKSLQQLLLLSPFPGRAVERGMLNLLSLCFAPLLQTAVEQSHHVIWRTPPQQKQEMNMRALKAWACEIVRTFCAALMEVDAESRRVALGVNAGDASARVDDAVGSVHNGTAALWLMREATVLTLLVLWSLQKCAA